MASEASQEVRRDHTESGPEPLDSAPMRKVELPEQQRRVVTLIARGYTTDQIATRLGISRFTVQAHRRAALIKIGVHSSVGLTHWAILRGLVEPGDVPGDVD